MSAPTSLRNPCTPQPVVGIELPHLKEVITTYIIHNMLSSSGAPRSNNKEKSRKGKRKMKEGGKANVGLTQVP